MLCIPVIAPDAASGSHPMRQAAPFAGPTSTQSVGSGRSHYINGCRAAFPVGGGMRCSPATSAPGRRTPDKHPLLDQSTSRCLFLCDARSASPLLLALLFVTAAGSAEGPEALMTRIVVRVVAVSASLAWCFAGSPSVLAAGWSVQPTPRIAGANSSMTTLTGVSCVSPTWCAVAGSYTTSPGHQEALVGRWNGKKWSILPPPRPGFIPLPGWSSLNAVSCTSQAACTAVGTWEHFAPIGTWWNDGTGLAGRCSQPRERGLAG
jgi:hypothetical protein